jgi:hypothetical protein
MIDTASLPSEQTLAGLEPADLRLAARQMNPGLTLALAEAMPADALLVDALIARWRLDPDLVPDGYALGHCHGHSPQADRIIKRDQPAQLAQSAIEHVEAGLRWEFDRTVLAAQAQAAQRFRDLIGAAIEERIATDPDLLALAMVAEPEIEGAIREALGNPEGTEPIAPHAALATMNNIPTLGLAARLAARRDPACITYLLAADPDRAEAANHDATQIARDVMAAFERRRDAERAEIGAMAAELARSAPAAEDDPEDGAGSTGPKGERGVLLDFQFERIDPQLNRWVTSRVYRWTTYPELIDSGRAMVADMRSALDTFVADGPGTGALRLAVMRGRGTPARQGGGKA